MHMYVLAGIALIPFALAALLYFVRGCRAASLITAGAGWLQMIGWVYLLMPLFNGTTAVLEITEDFFLTRLDASFILLTAAVACASFTHAVVFFDREEIGAHAQSSRNVRIHHILSMFFVGVMYLTFMCKNLGYLWICVESTTLLSAPLVFFGRNKNALEATWKYLIICSVGISFALLGTLFIFASSQHGAVAGGGTLSTDKLMAAATQLDPKLLRFGFIFCLLGYGTKAGMFPLHSWLPDAHSEAPAPSSALLSGSLLNCALFAVWRVNEIVDASTRAPLMNQITVWAGTITVVAASLFLIRQYALKRLFAYSSIENVGVMLCAIGLNSGLLFFMQALNHSITKVALFLLSGNIIQGFGKKSLKQQTGLMASAPGWAVLITMAAFAATGAPPFGTFLSELLILMQAMDQHFYVNAALLLLGLSLSFIVICKHVGGVILGAPNQNMEYFKPLASNAIPALLVLCSLLLGLSAGTSLWSTRL